MNSASTPSFEAILFQRVANQPVSNITTRPRAGGGIDHHRPVGPEHFPDAREHIEAQLAELRSAMIDRRLCHCGQHRERRVGGAGDLQEVATGRVHGFSLDLFRSAEANPGARSGPKQPAVIRRFSGL
jgi:hypothetical protein